MMLRVRQVKVKLGDDITSSLINKLKTNKENIIDYEIIKESVDSRKKPIIYLVYELKVNLKDESKIFKDNDITLYEEHKYNYKPIGNIKIKRPVIIGAGPAGLFAAYNLALNGYKPIIIERGSNVEKRIDDVDNYIKSGILNTNSNVQFGEGGAGTFSDGKLNTLIKDDYRIKYVLETFHKFGAHKDILYKAHPHIGTNILIDVVKNMRLEIIRLGGEFMFDTCLKDIVIENNKIKSILLSDGNKLDTDILILAIGHSARDTFYMLNKHLDMEAKPFALGIRISHPQKMIDISQYGAPYKELGPASYKLTYQASNGRGVYTFCMCPGGYVINSSSEIGMLAINGMSNHERDSENANSAVIVTVTPADYGSGALKGIEYQRKLESLAYQIGMGQIPVSLYKDFKLNNISTSFGEVKPLFKGGYTFANIRDILPSYISDALIEGIEYFGTKIKGFNRDDAIIAAIESRTSSPVRIKRNEDFVSNIGGIYPIGEGAGYAGGITSAAIDGIKASEKIMDKFTI